MTDETMDPRFERALRAMLADAEPADAPASLYAAVAAVPHAGRARRRWSPGRIAFAGLAMAAVVLVAVAVVALALRPRGDLPVIGGPSALPASPGRAAGDGLVVTYRVMPKGDLQPTATDLEAVARILQTRIDAAIRTSSLITTASPDRITVTVGIDTTDEAAVSRLRQLLGTTGHLDFVPLGDQPATEGDRLDLAAHPPLFSGDQLADVKVGLDQAGQRTVDFTLRPEGARLFADYTAGNIGTSFAIVLDGTVISAPTINSSIPDGQVQVTGGGIGGYSQAESEALVLLLTSGELPFPIQEVAVGGEPMASPSADAPVVTASPSPSAVASNPLVDAARAFAAAAGIAVEAGAPPSVLASRPDYDGAVLQEVTLPLSAVYAGDPQLRLWFDDAGRIAAVSNGEADVSAEGRDIDQTGALSAAAERFRLAGIDPATGTLAVAGGGPGGDWYVTLSREIDGHPVANTVMMWAISGDRAYVALRRDGVLKDLYAIRPSSDPAPAILSADALDAALSTLSGLSASELAALHPALAWVRATDPSTGDPAPVLTLGYCATQRSSSGWNGWCVDAGTGEQSVTGGGVD